MKPESFIPHPPLPPPPTPPPPPPKKNQKKILLQFIILSMHAKIKKKTIRTSCRGRTKKLYLVITAAMTVDKTRADSRQQEQLISGVRNPSQDPNNTIIILFLLLLLIIYQCKDTSFTSERGAFYISLHPFCFMHSLIQFTNRRS